MYVDSTDLTKNRVSATNGIYPSNINGYIVYAVDDTATVIVQMTVTYINSTITFSVDTLAANWKLLGAIIIS
jgi:hypothetical protein